MDILFNQLSTSGKYFSFANSNRGGTPGDWRLPRALGKRLNLAGFFNQVHLASIPSLQLPIGVARQVTGVCLMP